MKMSNGHRPQDLAKNLIGEFLTLSSSGARGVFCCLAYEEPEIKVDMFWIICPMCGGYMNIPEFDTKTGKAYHGWCIPK